jgi:hypothetical protein
MRGKSPAQAQHKIREMFDALTRRGADVKFGIHPGRAVFALVRIFPTKTAGNSSGTPVDFPGQISPNRLRYGG